MPVHGLVVASPRAMARRRTTRRGRRVLRIVDASSALRERLVGDVLKDDAVDLRELVGADLGQHAQPYRLLVTAPASFPGERILPRRARRRTSGTTCGSAPSRAPTHVRRTSAGSSVGPFSSSICGRVELDVGGVERVSRSVLIACMVRRGLLVVVAVWALGVANAGAAWAAANLGPDPTFDDDPAATYTTSGNASFVWDRTPAHGGGSLEIDSKQRPGELARWMSKTEPIHVHPELTSTRRQHP